MSKFKLLIAIMCLSVIAIHAWADGDSTSFFKTHPNPIDADQQGDSILFANKQIGIELQKSDSGFQISRLYSVALDQDFLTEAAGDVFHIRMTLDPKHVGKDERWGTKQGDWGLMEDMAGDAFVIGSQSAKSVSWRREGDDTESVLHLEWKEIDVKDDKGVMDVEVTITLKAGDPLSYWRINIYNRSRRYGIERVRFPIISLAPIDNSEDNTFVFPMWRGCVLDNPFDQPKGFDERFHTRGAIYGADFNMQFQALYNRTNGKGIYLGTQDSAPNLMNIRIVNSSSELSWQPGHFPPNVTFSNENYLQPYDCVVGAFKGDWYDACQIYRKWAIKQSWCSKGPLATRKDIPKWFKETPLHFRTFVTDSANGKRTRNENMLIAADHLREFLKWSGMKLPVHIYGWQKQEGNRGLTAYDVPFSVQRRHHVGRFKNMANENSYQSNYPKIPAIENFSIEAKKLKEEGGIICPFVSLQIFDPGPTENGPYAVEAKPNMTRDLYGNVLWWGSWVGGWQACPTTQWWRDRFKEQCELMMDNEHVGGFYLDVMHGLSKPCYWTPHGHSACGGTALTSGMHGLVKQIRDAVKAKDPEVFTTGENSSENMIDVIDGILYQRTIRAENKYPLFATVYQDYILRYALELSVDAGYQDRYKDVWKEDAFYIECASLFVEGAKIGMLRLRPRDLVLSFQNPDHKEMLDFLYKIVGYYKQDDTKKFLVYGRLLRPLSFSTPVPELPFTNYAVRTPTSFPALTSGVFRTDDGELGVFVVNASNNKIKFQAEMDLASYGVPAGTKVNIEKITPDGKTKKLRSTKDSVSLKDSLPAHGMTMFRIKPKI